MKDISFRLLFQFQMGTTEQKKNMYSIAWWIRIVNVECKRFVSGCRLLNKHLWAVN